jgi:hypothetical protein
MQEIQQPTGNFPAYLVVSELGRRKRMREKVAKEMPTQTVAEELATPPQPQMPQMGTMMPQGAPQGLMGMPQAQTELAAQDAMGTTPPEMMMPTQQMAGGGMVSFRQGGDIQQFSNGGQPLRRSELERYSPPASSMAELFGKLIPPGMYTEETLFVDPEGGRPITYQQYLDRFAQRGVAQPTTPVPAAVVPAAVAAPTTPAAAPTAPTAPAGAPPAAPPVARATIPVQPAPSVPEALTPYALATIGAQGASDYEQAIPDRTTKFFTEDIARREREIGGRRESNINEALIQAGLGIMGSKSPRFLQAASEGGLSALKVYREGAKDLRQSEEAINAARAKMIESQMLRDDRKFKAASDARKEAIELNNYGLNLAKTQSAIALQNVNAQRIAQMAPYEIAESQARAEAYRNRPAGLDKTIATPDQIAQARVAAMTRGLDASMIEAEIDAILAQSGLRRVAAGIPAAAAMPTAIDYSQAINASVSGN